MSYTVSDARQKVLENLDDESGARYAPPDASGDNDWTKVDRALGGALDSLLDDYVARGGDRFDEELEVETSASDGTADLATESIAVIRNVRVYSGTNTYRLEEGDKAWGGTPDRSARDLVLSAVRRFPLARNPAEDDLLVGAVHGAARSWDAFDELVCARAADALGSKDKETVQAVLRSVERLERSVFGARRTPSARPWPERRLSSAYLSGRIRWVWFQREQRLQLLLGAR